MFSGASANKSVTEAKSLIDQIQAKMRRIADEFAAGDINREQFYSIYEHYQMQLNLASAMLEEVEAGGLPNASSMETIALRKKLTGIAQAAAVYLYNDPQPLETLGEYILNPESVLPAIRVMFAALEKGDSPDFQIRQMPTAWALIVPGRLSVVVMLFSHEPVVRQIAFVQHMHRDFETANEAALRSGDVKAAKLVFPFASFVKKSVSRR
ncbi:MAG TPA: hypothetical protein PLD47_12890 [Aggregatilineales bacterium]|nr:hypothetical protein [Anaerolineales bacterium]HRE48614.1 hypothetical protein [Aggregatilineales bacterium]